MRNASFSEVAEHLVKVGFVRRENEVVRVGFCIIIVIKDSPLLAMNLHNLSEMM